MARLHRRRRWWVRALVGLGVSVGVLVLVVLGLVAVVLGTSAGTGWALTRGVAWYDGQIPGHVAFAETEGALADGLCIRGLRLADGQDHPLLTVDALCLRPRLSALLGRTVELERLSVEGVALHLWPDGAWGDLAPPSEPKPPDQPPGPDLPVRITAPLSIDGLDVLRHGEAGAADAGEHVDAESPLVRGAWLHAELEAEGRRASLAVRSVGGRFQGDVSLDDGELLVRWSAPVLAVDRLLVASSHGVVEARARLDTTEGALRYAAGVRANALVPMKQGNPPWRVPVELGVEGSADGAAVGASAWAPTLGRVELTALAAFTGETGVTAFVHAEPNPTLGIPPLHAWLTAQVPAEEPLHAQLMATAPGVLLAATWDGARARARATVDGTQVDASALLHEGKLRRVDARVAVASAARTTAAIDRLVAAEVPRVEGTARLAASCRVGEAWSCGLQAAVQQGADRLETAAEIDVGGEALEVHLQRLTGRLRGEPIRLAAPVHATVAKDAVSLTPLRLELAGGEIAAAGRVSFEGASDLEVRLARLDLGVVPRLVPSVPIDGVLDGELTARGELGQPRLHAALDVARLRWDRERLGDVRVEAGYDDERARADVRWSLYGTKVRARADVPLVLDPGGEGVALREHGTVHASVDVEHLPLHDVMAGLGGPRIGGYVDATVRASGRLRDPIVEAKVTGTELRFEDHAIGRAIVAATAREGTVQATVDVHGPAIDEAHVEATLPLALRPTRGGVAYRARERHELSARIAGLELAELEPWLGENAPQLAGVVRGEVEASAEAGAVEGHVDLLGRDLVLVGYDVGVTRVLLDLEEGEARAKVVASNSWARYAGVEASLPLELDGPLAAPKLSPQAPISARVELVDVELAGIGRMGPQSLPIAGELEGAVALSGTLRRPELDGELTIEGLRHGGKPLGDVRVRTGYDGEALVARLEQRHVSAKVDAYGRVPLGVDLATPAVVWHRERTHRLSVRLQGVDQDLVGLLVELPEDLELQAAARLEAHGTITDPHAAMQVRGHVQSGADDAALPIPVNVQVDVEPERQDALVMLGAHGPEPLVVEAHATAPLAALLAGRGDPSQIEVNAMARAREFDLRELAPFLPDSLHDPRGDLTLRASVQGPLTSPRMAGEIQLRDGALTVVPMRQQFTDIELRATMDGADLVLERLAARSAAGTATATASLHLEKGNTRGSAELTADELPLVRPGLPAMRLDLRVQADLDATGDVTTLALRASDGFLDVLAVSPLAAAQQIPEDDGVVYVDAQGLRQAKKEQRKEDREPWLPQDMAFSLELVDPLRVRGPQADMDWTGRFSLVRRPDVPPEATGMFSTQGGHVAMLGNEFDIESATIRFPETGELDPFVDLMAVTDTPDAVVTMLVRGRVSRPQLELRSDPPMPESDVFALLITGHADADEADDKEFSAKAAGVLAAFQNSALQRQLRDKVGIDRVGVGFGETVDQPIVTVGKRVSDKLYVEAGYHHNAPRDTNEAELRLEYRFAPPRWSVETFFGDAAQGGVGLWWQRRFATRSQRRAERRQGASSSDPAPGVRPDGGTQSPAESHSPQAPASTTR